jgi:hypothetical protein
VSKAPAILRSLSPTGHFVVSLVIGASGHSEALRLPIMNLEFPSSLIVKQPYPTLEHLPSEWEASKYSPEEEIHWTFRDGEKQPYTVLVMVFTAALAGPWILLAGLVSMIPISRINLISCSSRYLKYRFHLSLSLHRLLCSLERLQPSTR